MILDITTSLSLSLSLSHTHPLNFSLSLSLSIDAHTNCDHHGLSVYNYFDDHFRFPFPKGCGIAHHEVSLEVSTMGEGLGLGF